MAATCTNLVERRSGAGLTTGAGDRSGVYSGLCGKPTTDGATYCPRCTTTLENRRARAHANYHARIARQLRTAGEASDPEEAVSARCSTCSRRSS